MSANVANTEGGVSREKLMQDLRIVVMDAEELLRATASQAGEKASAARERIQEHLKAAKERLQDAEDLGLLAAHHVGHAVGFARQARHDGHAAGLNP